MSYSWVLYTWNILYIYSVPSIIHKSSCISPNFFLNVSLHPRSSSDCSCRTSPKERGPWLQLRPEVSFWRETQMETGRSAGKVGRPEGHITVDTAQGSTFFCGLLGFKICFIIRRSKQRGDWDQWKSFECEEYDAKLLNTTYSKLNKQSEMMTWFFY